MLNTVHFDNYTVIINMERSGALETECPKNFI